MENDAERSRSSQLPDDEKVAAPSIWIIELYTPSTVPAFFRGIRRLGLDRRPESSRDVTKWMEDFRRGQTGGWAKVGKISRSGDSDFFTHAIVPLPDGVRAAFPTLISVGPSLTGLVMQFVLDDDAGNRVEVPLRADYSTRRRRYAGPGILQVLRYVAKGGSIRLGGENLWLPDQVRNREAREVLHQQERACQEWVRDWLPGAFSRIAPDTIPTCRLLITEKARPFTEEARKVRAFAGLGIDRHFDSWTFQDWPGGSCGFDGASDVDDDDNRMVVAVRRCDAFPPSKLYDNSQSNWTLAHRIDEWMRVFLVRWASGCLLSLYREQLLLIRDRTAKQDVRKPISNLKKLRQLFRTTLLDLQSTAFDVSELAASDPKFRYGVIEPEQSVKDGKKVELLPLMRERQLKLASQIQRDAGAVQSTLASINDLTLAMSNMRLQRIVLLLTVVSVGLAGFSAFLVYLGSP